MTSSCYVGILINQEISTTYYFLVPKANWTNWALDDDASGANKILQIRNKNFDEESTNDNNIAAKFATNTAINSPPRVPLLLQLHPWFRVPIHRMI